jgi:protocatechuate 3,4-dioxygenase beta subunit
MLCRWFLLSLAIAHLAAQTVPERASVEGQVVNQRTGAPITGAQVKLVASDGTRSQAAADRKGHFSFSGLEAGQYRVEVERTGFTPLVWRKTVLTLAAGEQVKDFTVRLTPQAVVSGVLLDADGAPVANVYISVLRHTWRNAKRGLTSAGGAQTNDAGEYRVSGLAAGDYLVRAQPRELAVPPGDDKIKRIYVATWYPGVTDAGAAVPLHLTAGENRTGVTLTLRASTVVKVRGRVVRPPGKSEMSLAVVELTSPDDAGEMDIGGMAQANGPEGAFVIPDIPPGSYRIQAQLIDLAAGQQDLRNMTGASQIIQVGDTDIEGVTLCPAAPQTVTGLLKWDGKPPKDAGPCMVALQGQSGVLMSNLLPTTTNADGTFSLTVAPGRFDLNVNCESKGSYMKAARLGDADVLEVGIDGGETLPAGPLQVIMATGAGEIEGSVLDADSHPVGGATVVAIPDASKRAALFHRDITDQNGSFKLSDIVPGAYSLYAWNEVEDEAWRSDEFIKKYDDRRKRVQLDAGGRQALQLQLIKVE